MTGRDLIIYILENGLENEPVFKDGKFIGFVTVQDEAVKRGVGESTIRAHINLGNIDAVWVEGGYYIPAK